MSPIDIDLIGQPSMTERMYWQIYSSVCVCCLNNPNIPKFCGLTLIIKIIDSSFVVNTWLWTVY